MSEDKIKSGTEVLFIKREKGGSRTIEGCWAGKVYNFEKIKRDGKDRFYFDVKIEKGIQCPSKYTSYLEGWYVDEEPEEIAKESSYKATESRISELKQIKNETEYKKDKVDQQDLLAEFKKITSWWPQIKEEFGVSKHEFGRKINFVKGEFKRAVIFRDIEHAYALSKMGLSKPAVILAGSVMEELLRLYLKHKNIKVKINTFSEYIRACKRNGFLKAAVRSLTTSVRHFRNLIHFEKESKKKDTISRATAAGAVTSIFTLVNDF
ncbi:MAG: hypothetical protein ISS45_05485 [Candidatus Omnitrophica bacterium]|nr:hypothetical protein [Candidatus Omnitrophota bacterium]